MKTILNIKGFVEFMLGFYQGNAQFYFVDRSFAKNMADTNMLICLPRDQVGQKDE